MDSELLYIIEDAIRSAMTRSVFSLLISLLSYIFCSLSLYTFSPQSFLPRLVFRFIKNF